MAHPPSIKATAFQQAADDLNRLIETGKISREEVEARLRKEDLRFLDKQLAATTWVPIDSYRRVVEILIEVEAGGSSPEVYLHNRGVRAAQRLHKAGLYRQFEASSETWGNRVGKIAVTMAAVLYNFTKWSFQSDPDGGAFETTLDEARDYPDALRAVGEGFIQYLAENLVPGHKVEVTSERVTADRIVFRGRFS